MDRREQRVRRDRRRDGKQSNNQKFDNKKIIVAEEAEKKNEVKSTEKTVTKENTEEDDAQRFANLKRETDEIAALKSKKPLKRQIFSNWSKFEEPLPSLSDSQAVDFETLLHAPQSGNYFRFKSETQWDAGASFGQYSSLFSADADLLASGLTSLPFYTRLGLDKTLFSEEDIQKMDAAAESCASTYEKQRKLKVKTKKPEVDFSKIEQASDYNTSEGENNPPAEEKPNFTVEVSDDLAVSTPPTAFRSREVTPDAGGQFELLSHGLTFDKPPLAGVRGSPIQSPVASRESTPITVRQGESGVTRTEYRSTTPTVTTSSERNVDIEKASVSGSMMQVQSPTVHEPKVPSVVESGLQVKTNIEDKTPTALQDQPPVTEPRPENVTPSPKGKEKSIQNETRHGGRKHDGNHKGKQGRKKQEHHTEKLHTVENGEEIKQQDEKPSNTPKVSSVEIPAASKGIVTTPKVPEPKQTITPATVPETQKPEKQPEKSAQPAAVKEKPSSGRSRTKDENDHLDFLESLKGQKTDSRISEVDAAKAAVATVPATRSAIEEDELREAQKPKLPPVIVSEKKEDLEDWLDSMLDD